MGIAGINRGRMDASDDRFRCVLFHDGDVGSRLVVGDAGNDKSTMVGSNIEFRGLVCGELGTDDGAKSEGSSERKDHRGGGSEVIEPCTEWDNIAGLGEALFGCQSLVVGVDGDDTTGGVKTPGLSESLFFFVFFGSGFGATW